MPDRAASTSCDKASGMEVQGHETAIRGIDVPSKIARGSHWDGRNRFDLLRDIELDEDPDLLNTLEVKATSKVIDQPLVMDAPRSSPTRTALASAPLKRKRSATSSDKSRARKHVHMGDKVTVICDADACNKTGLPPGQSSFQRPRFSYTAADQARERRNFWRRSAFYRPRTWALSGDFENVNTSHWKTTWAEYEAIMGLQRWTEKRQEEAKQAGAAGKLKVYRDAVDMQVGVYAPPLVM